MKDTVSVASCRFTYVFVVFAPKVLYVRPYICKFDGHFVGFPAVFRTVVDCFATGKHRFGLVWQSLHLDIIGKEMHERQGKRRESESYEGTKVVKEPVVRVETVRNKGKPSLEMRPTASVQTISFTLKRKPIKRRYWSPYRPKGCFSLVQKPSSRLALSSNDSSTALKSVIASPSLSPCTEKRPKSVSPLHDYRRKSSKYSYFSPKTVTEPGFPCVFSPLAFNRNGKRLVLSEKRQGSRLAGGEVRVRRGRRVKTDSAINTEG